MARCGAADGVKMFLAGGGLPDLHIELIKGGGQQLACSFIIYSVLANVHIAVSSYRVINCNCNKRTFYCRATIKFSEVHNQFPISNIVTVLPCIGLVNPMDDLICLVKVGLNMEKTQKSLILFSIDGYLAFEMLPFLNALS